jgi:glutamate decarboxylase
MSATTEPIDTHGARYVGINDLLVRLLEDQGIDIPLHIDGASERVRSINVSGHKYGLVYPGLGWLVFRERSDLPEPYYNFVRYGREGYRVIMETMQANAHALAEKVVESSDVELVGDPGAEQLPLVAFKLAEERNFDEFDVASQLAAERGWMVPAYTLPPNAQHVTIMRALVKQTLGHSRVSTLAEDVAHAVATLSAKGGLHEIDRQRVKTGTGYYPTASPTRSVSP